MARRVRSNTGARNRKKNKRGGFWVLDMQKKWVHWNVCSDFYIMLNIKSVISLHALVNIHSYQQSFAFYECFYPCYVLKIKTSLSQAEMISLSLIIIDLLMHFLNLALMTFLKHQCTFFPYFNKNDNIYFQQRQITSSTKQG